MRTSGIPLSSLPAKMQEQVVAQLHPRTLDVLPVSVSTEQRFVIRIEPMGKPRMTQRDKWKKRPNVVRFRAYADKLREVCDPRLAEPLRVSWVAFFSMPESWSKNKKAAMVGKPHREKPDRDNVDKGILDSLWENDAGVASGELIKLWDDGRGARIELEIST